MAVKRNKKHEIPLGHNNVSSKIDTSKSKKFSFHSILPSVKVYVVFIAILSGLVIYKSWDYLLVNQSQMTLARSSDVVHDNKMVVRCSNDYDGERDWYPNCAPKMCQRVVTDDIVSSADAVKLLDIAKRAFHLGGSSGGASILDLHSGALSQGSKFVNIYVLLANSNDKIFSESDFILYNRIKENIRSSIAQQFNIDRKSLYLTKPTFFSRITTQPAQTVHDEYWHVHIDKETYGSFHYTSLLYLSDYNSDFTGGRFVFVDKEANVTVEPRVGRLSYFTSGSENKHYVEKVQSGTRYAITVSFTCDQSKAINDPELPS